MVDACRLSLVEPLYLRGVLYALAEQWAEAESDFTAAIALERGLEIGERGFDSCRRSRQAAARYCP